MEESKVVPFLRVVSEEKKEAEAVEASAEAESAAEALEMAAKFIREHGCIRMICAALLPEDKLVVWRNQSAPMHEALGMVEMIRLHVVGDFGNMTEVE